MSRQKQVGFNSESNKKSCIDIDKLNNSVHYQLGLLCTQPEPSTLNTLKQTERPLERQVDIVAAERETGI